MVITTTQSYDTTTQSYDGSISLLVTTNPDTGELATELRIKQAVAGGSFEGTAFQASLCIASGALVVEFEEGAQVTISIESIMTAIGAAGIHKLRRP